MHGGQLGLACDIDRADNLGLTRQELIDCFKQCFPGGSFGQEEYNAGNKGPTHFHLQFPKDGVQPPSGGTIYFAPGIIPNRRY